MTHLHRSIYVHLNNIIDEEKLKCVQSSSHKHVFAYVTIICFIQNTYLYIAVFDKILY